MNPVRSLARDQVASLEDLGGATSNGMKTFQEAGDLNGRKVLLRTDFDVPVLNQEYGGQAYKIQEKFRIEKQKELIDHLLNQGAKVLMVAHISSTPSFKNILSGLEEILGHKIEFFGNIENANPEKLGLLENIRSFPGEELNDELLAKKLASGRDLYINNAFAVCHRNHASVSAITKLLPSFAGPIIEKEVCELQKVIDAPVEGKLIIMGGAKTSTKIPVIKNFMTKADVILLGGVIANDALVLRGYNVRSSVVDANFRELFEGIDINSEKIVMPEDFAVGEDKILDIGKQTIGAYKDFIAKAKLIIWNGPLGQFEIPTFAIGTKAIAKAIVESVAYKIIGGGDTIAAVDQAGLISSFDFVSTGGGAMLDFLAGKEMPGLKALE